MPRFPLKSGSMLSAILLGIFLLNCEKIPVTPIDWSNDLAPTFLPQFQGKIINSVDGIAIGGAVINLDGITQTTDTQGNFSFDSELAPGSINLTIQAAGYLSVSKTVVIPHTGSSLYREYQLVATAPPVTVTAAEGGEVDQISPEGTFETTIPAGAVTEDTQISVTPTLGSSSPVDVNTIVTAADEAPAQSVLLEPQDIQFNQPVEMQAPLSFPAEYVTGQVDVIRINPSTNQPEVVGTATVENGKFKYNITRGGQYIVIAKTNLRHTVQTVREVLNIGTIGFNETPGTFRNFTYNEISSIDPAAGFSENFIEGIYGFSDGSREIGFNVAKDPGINSAITAYVVIEKLIHTYATTSGQFIAKITQDNTGSESSYEGNFQAKWNVEGTHGTVIFLGWWSPNSNRYLTITEINNLGLPNPPSRP